MAKHIHADLMMQYAQDAAITPRPWEWWEVYDTGRWISLTEGLYFRPEYQYRRKPRFKSVMLESGEVVSWPEPQRTELKQNTDYFYANVSGWTVSSAQWNCSNWDKRALASGWIHLTKEAAEQHIAALRKINTQGM